MFKYELNKELWVMHENKARRCTVAERMYRDSINTYYNCRPSVTYRIDAWEPNKGYRSHIINDWFSEDRLFETREALLESL